MRPFDRSVVTAVLVAPLLALLAHCDPVPPRDQTADNARSNGSSGGSSSAGPRTARLDLHCTPQHAEDEAACRARGTEYEFGPRPHGHGTEPPPEVVEAERRAYEAGTEPCVCMSQQERRQELMVP